MSKSYPVGPPIHLKGEKNMQRLVLDPQAGFLYKDPESGTLMPCQGVCQIIVAVPRTANEINDIPFLPYRDEQQVSNAKSKTYRMSCKKCLLEQRESLCPHSLEERSFRSTYCLCEIFHAYSLGYVILQMEEALIYTQSAKIFSSFFKLCASYKIRYDNVPEEHSDRLPEYCQQINEGMAFTEDFERLTPELLVTNLSEKTATKNYINTIIGKLGQRPAQPCLEFVSDPERLDAMFSDGKINIQSVFHVTDDTLQVNYLQREEFIQDSRKTSPILNALVTAHSRIHLDENLRKLQSKGISLLYIDTDSCIIKARNDLKDIGLPLHSVIFGHFKSEVPPGLYIRSFLGLRYVQSQKNLATCGHMVFPAAAAAALVILLIFFFYVSAAKIIATICMTAKPTNLWRGW